MTDTPLNLAELALEVRLNETDEYFAQLSFVLWLGMVYRGELARDIEVNAHRIGLSPDVARNLIENTQRRTQLLGEAHKLIKALIPHEQKVMHLVGKECQT